MDRPESGMETGNIFASPDGRFLYVYEMSASSPETGEFIGAIVEEWGVIETSAHSP